MDYWEIVWLDFKSGDDDAFEKIYYKHIDILYRYGSKISKDKDLIKDCIQQLFLELLRSRKNLINPASLEFYLLKALKRIIIHRITKDQKQWDPFSNELPSFTLEFDFEKEMIRAEEQQQKMGLLTEALESLSTEKRELIFLKFYSGLNNEQIAGIMGLKSDTVQKQIYRTLKKLQVTFVSRFLELFVLCFKL